MNIIRSRNPFPLIRTILVFVLVVASIISITTNIPHIVQGASYWTATSNSLTTPRGNFGTVRLADGKVLVAGGWDSGQIFKSAEIYDPGTNSWISTGSMANERKSFAIARLDDGRVLAAGGVRYDGSNYVAINSAEVYTPSSGTWVSTGNLPINLAFATATALSNGNILIAGGTTTGSSGLATAYLYNPTAGTFSSTANNMRSGRWNQTATLLSNGKVLLVGGTSGNGTSANNTIDLYDPNTNTWATTGLNPMAQAREHHTATLLANGKVLVVGGASACTSQGECTELNSAEIYDPSSGTWSSAGTLNPARYSHEAALLGDGTVLVAGGTDDSNILSSAQIYDPIAGTWSTVNPSMSTTRIFHSLTTLSDYKVLATAGSNNGTTSFVGSAEVYSDDRSVATIALGNLNQQYDGTPRPASATTNPGGLNVSLYYTGIGSTVYGPSATPPTLVGNYHVSAVIESNSSYVGMAADTLTISKGDQTITFDPLSDRDVNEADFAVNATASSGLAVSFSVGVTDQCTLHDGNMIHITAAGSCTVTASQNGSANYNSATPVSRTFNILDDGKISQTITFAPLQNKVYGNPNFDVSATASSGLPVSFSASGNCSLIGSVTIQITGAGSCTVTASQEGNETYRAAVPVPRTFTINRASQVISFDPLPNKTYGIVDFPVNATTSSSLPVSFSVGVTDQCTLHDGNMIHITAAGNCNVTASQNGDANYNPASPVTRSFTISKANQSITFGSLSSKTYGDADFAVSATTSFGLSVSFSASGNCTLHDGNMIHITAAGSCDVTASQNGDANYNPASPVTRSFTISKANQSITFGSLSSKT
ncbi:MAG TPA: kelch repeat-containing protein, partial [Anaerolineaceae bacterium]|nr:kelch repeat-containing protein [Anaerolineaceae bacterium]